MTSCLGSGPYCGFITSAMAGNPVAMALHIAAVAVVDVVGADQLAHKALQQVVAFVGQLGAADGADGVGAVLAA